MIKLLSKFDPVLKNLLENKKKHSIAYLSPAIQTEVIEMLGNTIKQMLHYYLFLSLVLYFIIIYYCCSVSSYLKLLFSSKPNHVLIIFVYYLYETIPSRHGRMGDVI